MPPIMATRATQPMTGPESGSEKKIAAWRYVIPNAITALSLVFGLVVLTVASEGEFELAGWFTVWCVLLDKLDGTFARLLGSSSKFGAQLDSLADLVVFGVAPAGTILLLARTEHHLFTGWLGNGPGLWAMYAMLALFVVCASLRLAKFNVLADEGGPPVFYGFPTTFAGGVLALLLLIGLDHELDWLLRALPVLALCLGLLMVSNIMLPKLGHSSGKAFQVFRAVNLALVYVFGFMRMFPEYLLGISLFFMAMGVVYAAMHREELLAGGGDASTDDDATLEPQPS